MNKEDKLMVQLCLEEIERTIKALSKPTDRKVYLIGKKWYKQMKDILKALKYRGKVERLPKHKLSDLADT